MTLPKGTVVYLCKPLTLGLGIYEDENKVVISTEKILYAKNEFDGNRQGFEVDGMPGFVIMLHASDYVLP